ncbi:DUF1178 family protein [Jannaschia formosa]|uniref:DUF1178 family protein n=1 Tax=Jannaschia formosa TaxID=2259592 RepID=UPI000E1B8693|nr:DUF1178 family protein [Jannaschia formosa]TFL18165.1 DUF1178 family protein [Jannaschia formosa]
MIRYALRCKEGHDFESWFASADAYDALSAKRLVSCAVCGVEDVSKALMAPKVAPRAAPTEMERKIAELRRKVEAEATYVGPRFAAEARAIHEAGESRPIYGEANAAEARELIADGIPVAPLPFLPKARTN